MGNLETKVRAAIASQPSSRLYFILSVLALYNAVHPYQRAWSVFTLQGIELVGIAAICGVLAIIRSRQTNPDIAFERPRRLPVALVIVALLGTHIVTALIINRAVPATNIDVYFFHTDCLRALLHGANPYSITHQSIYTPAENAIFYGPGVVANGRLQFGFPYPPIALLFTLPGYLLGDVRYMCILAVAIAGLIMLRLRPGLIGEMITALFLLNPVTWFVENRSWTESLTMMLLAVTVYAAMRQRWWLPIALGLMIASKQYGVLALPFAGFLLPQFEWKAYFRLVSRALLTAIVVTAPLALWNIHAFWNDVVLLHLKQPFRRDSLTFAVLHPIPTAVLLLVVLAGTWLCLARAKRHPSMFAASFGLVFLFFVCLNKQAFTNYYFLVIGAFCLAACTIDVPSARRLDTAIACLSNRKLARCLEGIGTAPWVVCACKRATLRGVRS